MTVKLTSLCAITALALIALNRDGSLEHPANLLIPGTLSDPGAAALNADGKRLFAAGRYSDARDSFVGAARLAESSGDLRSAAMNRNNAGASELMTLQFADALKQFSEAKRIAETSSQTQSLLLYARNNLANLYLQTGQPENALLVAREALNSSAAKLNEPVRAALLCQVSLALLTMHRIEEARPAQREAVASLTALNQLQDLNRLLAKWADDNLRDGRPEEAALALDAGMELIRTNKVKPTAGIIAGLANLAASRHQGELAARYFQTALDLRQDRLPRWKILADRGRFLLESNNEGAALADFRSAGQLVSQVRDDMVPADQDRVAFETGLGRYLQGLVEAGNRIALRTSNTALMAETFEAAEKNRLWSLRSLLPGLGDWRSRLPSGYWEKLARYQALQRRSLASGDARPDPAAKELTLELQQMEAVASGRDPSEHLDAGESPLHHVRTLLDPETVLFSFHLSQEGSWLWAVTRTGVRVFRLPPEAELRAVAEEFTRTGLPVASGRKLYQQLFGSVPQDLLRHSHWLLEPDGALHDVPFAALVADDVESRPVYLVERASVQVIPGALLLQKRPFRIEGSFIGVGDPVYNAADPRFVGEKRKPDFSLPRLPRTANELLVSSRGWAPGQTHLLTGMSASADSFWRLSSGNPSVVHFATHVVAGTGDYRSGLIALRLSPQGSMELLGPTEILARSVSADLVVMNGCHSAQGEAVPSSGRMGLTRAWIGSGAGSVLATRWDISDDDAESFMTSFYGFLRSTPGDGIAQALRRAQLQALHASPSNPARWSGYYLLSRAI